MSNTEKNGLQKSIEQIGIDNVVRYLPRGMRLHTCEIHGKYLGHYKDKNPLCPLCAYKDVDSGTGNGTTATQVEQEIDAKDSPVVYISLV